MNPRIPHAIALLALLCTWFSWPVSVQAAACCACTHPQIKGGKFCIQGTADCAGLKDNVNKQFTNAACSEDNSANPCKKTTSGGTCLNDPSDAVSFKLSSVPGYSPEAAQETGPPELPVQLNIDIPGLTFYAPYKDSNEVIIPMLAQYIQAFQKVLIGLSLVAAAIMLVYGGWLYIISGTGMKVADGKKIIIDALIGMVITLGAIVILSNINPNTAQLGALHLSTVNPNPYTPLTKGQYSAAAGLLGANPNMPSASEMLTDVKAKAKEKGLDPCIAWAIMNAESGGRLIVGHDENWYAGTSNVIPQSRVDFMRSRKYYSGKEFPSDVPAMPGECSNAQAACHNVAGYKPSGSGTIVENDDVPKFDQPPDFGIDWRFSHGFGAGITVFKSSPLCSNGWRGYTMGGKCYSVPELVTKEGQIQALFATPAFWKNGKVGGEPNTDPMSAFKAWAGCQDSETAKIPCSRVQKLLDIKQRYYETCKASGG
jgi:hypothetical protein